MTYKLMQACFKTFTVAAQSSVSHSNSGKSVLSFTTSDSCASFLTHQETNETLGVKYPVQLQVNVEKSESDESTKVIREGGLLRQDFVLIRGAFWLACSEANIFTSIDNCR